MIVRELYEAGRVLVDEIGHGLYVEDTGTVCRACVNGAIAVGAVGWARVESCVGPMSIQEAVPILALELGPADAVTCPVCDERDRASGRAWRVKAWRNRWKQRRYWIGMRDGWEPTRDTINPRVTVLSFINHLFEDHYLDPDHVLAYVEAQPAVIAYEADAVLELPARVAAEAVPA